MSFGLVANESEAADAGNGVRIYVAGASAEMARAKTVIAKLKEKGFTVVSTWTDVITKVGDANPMSASREDRAEWSTTDLMQVADAEVLWLLLPPKGTETIGAYIELGFAMNIQMMMAQAKAAGMPAPERFIVTSGTERSIFTALTNHYVTDDEALEALVAATVPA